MAVAGGGPSNLPLSSSNQMNQNSLRNRQISNQSPVLALLSFVFSFIFLNSLHLSHSLQVHLSQCLISIHQLIRQ